MRQSIVFDFSFFKHTKKFIGRISWTSKIDRKPEVPDMTNVWEWRGQAADSTAKVRSQK